MEQGFSLVLPGSTLGNPPILEHFQLASAHGFDAVSVRTGDWLAALDKGVTPQQLLDNLGELWVADIDCIAPILGSGQVGGEFYGATEDDVLRCAEMLEARSVNLILQRNSTDSPTRRDSATRRNSAAHHNSTKHRNSPAGNNSPERENIIRQDIISTAAADVARVADRAKDLNLLVHLEPVPFMDITDPIMALEIVELADRDNLGIQIDAWHYFRGPLAANDTDCDALSSLDGDKIFAVQICDAKAVRGHPLEDTMKRRLMPGRGQLNLSGFLTALGETTTSRTNSQINSRAPLSVEVFNYETTAKQREQLAAEAATAVKDLLAEVD